MTQHLFPGMDSRADRPAGEPAAAHLLRPSGLPRLRRPERQQMEFRAASLDQLLPPEHPVRLVWDYVTHLDLTPLLQRITAVAG